MSVDASRRALDWSGRDPVGRHVLAVIGIDTDHHSDWARVTLDELAAETGYARGSIIRIIRRLVDAGALNRRGSGGRNPSEYQVNRRPTDALAESVEPTPNRRPTDAQPTPGERQKQWALRDRDRDREKQPPLIPPRAPEGVQTELLPAPTPNGATPPRATVEAPGFRDFWAAYPRKVARARAEAAYRQAVRRDGPDLIAGGLAAWSAYWSGERTEEKYIPHPTTFLNQARYLDAPPATRPPEPKGYAGLRAYLEHHQGDDQ